MVWSTQWDRFLAMNSVGEYEIEIKAGLAVCVAGWQSGWKLHRTEWEA